MQGGPMNGGPMNGGQMQGGPNGGGPMNGGPGNGWGNHPDNGNNGWNGWGWRGRGNGNWCGYGFYPQQFSGSYFTRPYPYHLDYYRMRYGGSYAPYYGNLYGQSNSFYPAQYNGDFGPNYFFGQNNPGPNDANYGTPPTNSDSGNGGGHWRWCWVPYTDNPTYDTGPPVYERGPVEPVYPVPSDAAPINAFPNNTTEQPNSTTSSQPAGGNTSTPALTPAH
jgi:hypothetical protein